MDIGVVMPTHGHGAFRRFVLGSVTAKVLHDVHCPVLTGAHVEEIAPYSPQPYRHVACAVDLSEQSQKALCWAAEFAAAYKAKLQQDPEVKERLKKAPGFERTNDPDWNRPEYRGQVDKYKDWVEHVG